MTKGKVAKTKEVASKVPTKGNDPKQKEPEITKKSAPASVEKKTVQLATTEPEVKKENEDEHRESGNAAFKLGQFKKAIKYYTECIEIIQENNLKTSQPDPESNEFIKLMKSNECLLKSYNNRTQCFINTEKWQHAIDDATKGIYSTVHKDSYDFLMIRKL